MEELYFDDLIQARSITIEQLEAAIRGRLRVYSAGKAIDMQLTPKELAAYKQAKERHYLVKEPGKDQLANIYHQYCISAKTYSIEIRLHANAHDNCNLGEDHATFWYDLFLLQHGLTPQAFKTLQRHFERARPGAYEFTESKLGVVWGRALVPEYTAEKLAKALVAILDDPTAHSFEMFDKE